MWRVLEPRRAGKRLSTRRDTQCAVAGCECACQCVLVCVCVCLSVSACVCSLDSVEAAAEPSHPLRALRVCLCAGNAQQQSALQENDTIRLRRLPGCPAHRPPPTVLAFCLAGSNCCHPSLLAGGERHVMADECRCRELAPSAALKLL